MGVYLQAGDAQTPLATTRGWGDFCRWAATAGPAAPVAHLCAHGWYEPAGELAAALPAAGRPAGDVGKTYATLAAAAAAADPGDAALVTDGLAPAGPDDDEEARP